MTTTSATDIAVVVGELVLVDEARPLLIVHAVLAVATAGSSVHLGVLGALLLIRQRAPTKLIRTHSKIAPVLYAATFLLGSLIYPAFRVLVRGMVLDGDAPWASDAFDTKEMLAMIGIPFALAIFLVGRRFELPRDQQAAPLVGVLGLVLGLIVTTSAILGLIVTSVRGPQ